FWRSRRSCGNCLNRSKKSSAICRRPSASCSASICTGRKRGETPMKADIRASLRAENAELRARLADAEETLLAIRNGEVDALVVGERLYMLTSADAASNQLSGRALEKDELLTQITDLPPTLLTRCSRDLRYLFANRAKADFLGLAPEEIAGKTIREILGDGAFTTILPYIERVLRGERVEYDTEITYPVAGRRFMHVTYVPEY